MKYFFSGLGIKLQNFDAMMAEAVINHFTSLGIPILCIHDSFVIAADKTKELDKVMTDYATKEASMVNTSIEEDLESQEEALIEE